MIFGSRRVRVFACAKPTDMRKSFDTLAERVRADLDRDALSGDLFLFVNARRNRAKILLWDGTGLCIYMKRLEKGRFAAPWRNGDGETIAMTSSELALFLEGSPLVFVGRLSPPEVHEETVATRIPSRR